ncbi:cysteine-rich with EGF-like domain protein 2 isoform X2 [Watersipora subatra]|uniref:cysteine-rich with EGF-like domain protein 2 isoform X2 n=1 Tax=Watersipora subatra TaxID=2589382 RepID=UPI00355BCBB9
MLPRRCSYIFLIVYTSLLFSSHAKTPCDICKDIISSFEEGLAKTVKSNFGGGNTNWEEKSLGKWKTSETRLVEIIDHHICRGNNKECHMFFERNEEHIEDWYFNIYKDLDSSESLHHHLCVEQSKACCTDGRYGPTCSECPTSDGKVCGGHGKCQGDGTRSGTGSCTCDSGYTGKVCEECADNYYEQLTGTISTCLACHESCEDSCTGGEPIACDDCKDGYTWSDTHGCQDTDECSSEDDPCQDRTSTYCSNTIGSYLCQACHSNCLSCTGAQSNACTECIPGYVRTTPDIDTSSCDDINECTEKPELCKSLEGAECRNTEGSYDCRCTLDNQKIEGDKCVDIPEPEEKTQQNIKSKQAKESVDKTKKGKSAKKVNKKSDTVGKDGSQPKIDIDSMMKEAGSVAPGQKRKYRTLDTMVLSSATGLYLVMCLVFNAELLKTSLATLVYAVFVYSYAGQYA